MNPFEMIVCGLAAWRLASLFSREGGPFGVFTWIRKQIYRGTVYTGIVGAFFRTLHDGINCVYCSSVWFAVLVYFMPFWFSAILAISTISILIEVLHGKSID